MVPLDYLDEEFVMVCNNCQCQGIESIFDDKGAQKELKHYRKKGPRATTRELIDALVARGVAGLRLLDIGGGVGAIQHELLQQGVESAVDVDAASAYLQAAMQEAGRLGFADKAAYRHGNFVELAPDLDPADIVTLDRVICCYDDMPALVAASVGLAQKVYGIVIPLDNWLTRLVVGIGNLFLRVSGSDFRSFIHPTAAVENIVEAAGFQRVFYRRRFYWQVIVYAKEG